MADQNDDGDDPPALCEFCGGSLDGQPFLALGLFGVITGEGDGMFFEPDASPVDITEWDDVFLSRCLHITCIENYCAGVLVEAGQRRRTGGV